ncbi:MAG TPA: IPT/TIG domain-containing protein [Terriglobia bacterium]|nr:IPT/TIG domain-containing protein [Terriglobia bacterium]
MKKYSIILLILVCSATAAAYTRITLPAGQTPKWTSMPISYWINDRGSSQISNGSEFAAIHAAFQTWQNVQTADVRFTYKGTTPVRSVGRDGMNVVSFADDSTPLGSSVVAATFSFFRADSAGGVVFDESDIIFNPVQQFSTSVEDSKFDVQGVLTHEIGHLLGLDHAGLVSSVMVPFAALSQLDQRTLAYDDAAAITEIYPKASTVPPVGQISGVVQSGGVGAFGAHVVAVDRDGTALVSTLSQRDGSYLLRFLPAGPYRVFAEPLDQPVTEQNIGGGGTAFYRNLKVDFGTTYFGNVANLTEAPTVDVTAGDRAIADIQTLPQSSTGLNLTRPSFAPRISRGAGGTLRLGGEDLTDGAAFFTSNNGIVLGSPTFGGRISPSASTSATMGITVSPLMPLGPKSIAVTRGGSSSIVGGALVITDVSPSGIAVGPAWGPAEGGTPVTVTGANFRPGAQVFFGGLPATDTRVVDSGNIQATAPASIPGASNLVVVNADGTWGVATGGFTYLSERPTITQVTPLSGPPATTVTIQGVHFDTRTQNIDVRFNGVSARVVSATASAITAIVPFGAASGPITISIFGQLVTGPTFTITSATSSTNLAGSGYNFVDASVAAGGAGLSFNNTDDSVAAATLPFNFSLFRDIYLAGSQISIATNGWLSLEALSNAEFQNASLPAQTVTRTGGSIGTVPPSLVAPFWDDLALKSNSAVTTRTIGSAPNRRFVIEWANLSILDENGTDVDASLTFEAILFEGSNDIQFVYQNLSGPRSDGSNATVGGQDLKRATAFQAGFNQAILRSGSFITYHFLGGTYTAAAPDSTPPTKPVISDGGALTQSRTELLASWTSEDPESGIREFQYAIGKTPGGTDVRPFTSTTQSSVLVTGLNLDIAATYYFVVRAINTANLTSEVGMSDGIRIDPTFQPQVRVIPAVPHGGNQFSGLALYAPTAMSVVLKAMDSSGALISGVGVRNPTAVTLAAGQQYARLISEIFAVTAFDGWIEVEASANGLGIYTATGSADMTQLDGNVVRDLSTDFVLLHTGATTILVNPSTRTANVTVTTVGTANIQSLTIAPRSRMVMTSPGVVRVQSSEALAAEERFSSAGKLGISAAVPVTSAQLTLVFPQGATGLGYTSMLTIANTSNTAQAALVTFGGVAVYVRIESNSATRVSLASFLQLSPETLRTGAVVVTAFPLPFGMGAGLLGVLDIESPTSLVSIGARPPVTEAVFAQVAQGNGLFTGLCFATGSQAANITIEVYEAGGGTPRSATIPLAANSQIARQVSELVPAVTTQVGGYIRIRSDQPVWTWEVYGSAEVMASGPPL